MNTTQPARPQHHGPSPAATAEATWQALLRNAIRAPSSHNTQPWRFEISGDRLLLYADRTRALPVVDPDDRALVISCGAALGHLLIALRHFGHAGETTAFPDPDDPDLLAAVRLGPPRTPEPEDDELFAAIDRRRTDRAAFEDRPVPNPVLEQLQCDAVRAGAALQVLTTAEPKAAVARLVAAGDRAQFADPAFRRELGAWMRPNRTRRPDGIPGHALGIPDVPSLLAPRLIAVMDTGATQARKDEKLARTAPALLLLSTIHDTPAGWLVAGRALAFVLLRATALGLRASFLNQPIEVPTLRPRLRDLTPCGPYPQLLLRVGYPRSAHDTGQSTGKATPRRAVADVLTVTTSRIAVS